MIPNFISVINRNHLYINHMGVYFVQRIFASKIPHNFRFIIRFSEHKQC